jgi:hypothetical protein
MIALASIADPRGARQGPGRKEGRVGSDQLIYQPPLTLMVWPVM